MCARILVPLDGSERGDESIEIARLLARRTDATLLLLRTESWLASKTRAAGTSADLESRVEALRAAGFHAYSLMQFGHPGDAIITTARYQHSDLIVLARHASDVGDTLAGKSLTLRMLTSVPAPLLVLPATLTARDFSRLMTDPARSILAALDGSGLAERALPCALELAKMFAQSLRLVRVLTAQPAAADEQQDPAEARRYLDLVRERLSDRSATAVQTALIEGTPASELLRYVEANPISLLVTGTHGRTGLARLRMGSVAAELIQHSPVPLLIAPPEVRLRTDHHGGSHEQVIVAAPVGGAGEEVPDPSA